MRLARQHNICHTAHDRVEPSNSLCLLVYSGTRMSLFKLVLFLSSANCFSFGLTLGNINSVDCSLSLCFFVAFMCVKKTQIIYAFWIRILRWFLRQCICSFHAHNSVTELGGSRKDARTALIVFLRPFCFLYAHKLTEWLCSHSKSIKQQKVHEISGPYRSSLHCGAGLSDVCERFVVLSLYASI